MSRSTGDEDKERIRRILVALDASPSSLAALQAAADLAAANDAELYGIYVEDVNLLRLADLPLVRQQSLFFSGGRSISRQQLERELRIQARQARRALEDAARRRRLRWTFRTAQGIISVELLAAASEADLIILGKAGWSRRRRLGSTARVVITQAPQRTLILQQGAHLGLPVGILYDGSPLARQALAAGVRLLFEREGYLVVMILAGSPEQARELQSEASEILRSTGVHLHFRWLLKPSVKHVVELVRAENISVLAVPIQVGNLSIDSLTEILDELDVPALILR